MYRTLHTCSIGHELGADGTVSAIRRIFKPEPIGSSGSDDAGSFHRILERSVAEHPAMEGQSEHVSRTQYLAIERQPDISGQAATITTWSAPMHCSHGWPCWCKPCSPSARLNCLAISCLLPKVRLPQRPRRRYRCLWDSWQVPPHGLHQQTLGSRSRRC